MVNYTFNQTEMKSIWKHTKNKRYSIQSFINCSNRVEFIIFDDIQTRRMCTGKIVTKFSEGEIYHWPRLHHSNLAPLLDVIYIDERLGVCMTTHLTYTLRDIIHIDSFINDSLIFDRKKAYIEDILLGVDYIHSKNLSLMNVSDANVLVCPESDTAVIANFTCLVTVYNATKHKKCAPYMYRAPELSLITPFEKKKDFNPIFSDLWSLGVMIMEIFLSHATPWGLVDYDPSRALEVAANIEWDMLKFANKGSSISKEDVNGFKKFLGLFLDKNPKNRCPAYKAVSKNFIQNGKYRLNLKDTNFTPQSKAKVVVSDHTDFSSHNSEECPATKFNKESMPSLDCEVTSLNHQYPNNVRWNLKESPTIKTKLKNVQKMNLTIGSELSNVTIGDKSYSKANSVSPHITTAMMKSQNEVLSGNQELQSGYHPNKLDKRNSLMTLSDDLKTKSNSSCKNNIYVPRRFSESGTKATSTQQLPNRNFILHRASAPALHNSIACDLQHDTKQARKYSTLSLLREDGHTLGSKGTDNSKYMIMYCDKQDVLLADEDIQIETENLKGSTHDYKLTLNHPIADQIKKPSIKSKTAIVDFEANNACNIDAWSEEKKISKSHKNRNQSKSSYKETSRHILPEYEYDTSFKNQKCSVKNQGSVDMEQNEISLSSNDHHSSLDFNFVLPEPVPQPRKINVIRHRRGCSHRSQKGNKNGRIETQSRNTANVAQNVLSTKQKCEVSKLLLKAGGKISNMDMQQRQQFNDEEFAKDRAIGKKGKVKNCFCFL